MLNIAKSIVLYITSTGIFLIKPNDDFTLTLLTIPYFLAKYIVAITSSGYTAREIAKYRPFIPMLVFTPHANVAREMSIVWGVYDSFVQFIHLNRPLTQIRETLLKHKLIEKGEEIVVCNAGFGRREKLITTTMI